MKWKVLIISGTVVVGASLVVGFTKVDAPTEAKADAPTKEEINEMMKDYPKNTPLTPEMSDKVTKYLETVEMNEEPSHESWKDNPTVVGAVVVYQREDEALQKKIRFTLPYGSLLHYNTFEKGFYPQELLDQSVERDLPILESVKAMSDNAPLNILIDETIEGITVAMTNGDAEAYFEAWAHLDSFHDRIGELSDPRNVEARNELDRFTLEIPEYSTLEVFVTDIAKNWADGSEYRSYQDDRTAEMNLANSVLHYVNWFESSIEEAGMTEAFEEWQLTAYVLAFTKAGEDESVQEKFENQMNNILSNL
ncbi:hypothetical protein [Bacillus timonensis]|uniref:hypothetical protein n=1 Tax=Bacillus timonensis TaxID=1033734 RepID=UPI000287A819|nr:hypothetical protein [Bacillus timonensis]